jgi:hypothetical protein
VIQGKYHSGVSANAPFWDANITGFGQVVGVGDGGADRRNCYLSATSKFVMYRATVMENGVYNVVDDDGHGTHVCGSIAGNAGSSGSYVASGSENYDGVAKDAQLAFTDIGWSGEGYGGELNNMGSDYYQHAYDLGARIHSDSWGYKTRSYGWQTYEVDEFAAANPMFLPMFAMMNEGETTPNGLYTHGTPANAKNILAIGATLSSNSAAAHYFTGKNGGPAVWSVEIGGPDAKHWAHSNIRGLSPWWQVSDPDPYTDATGSTHSILAQYVRYADPADGCSTFTNAAAADGRLVLISSRGSCSSSTIVRPRPFSMHEMILKS